MAVSTPASLNLRTYMMHCTVIGTRDLSNVIFLALSGLVVHDLKY